MIPRIEILEEKKLIGMNETMSLTNNKTFKLFSTFMPRKKEITNTLNQDVFDLRIYTHEYYREFNPNTEFIKWALVEVSNIENIPDGMQAFTLVGGQYAVFDYKGLSSDSSIFQYIFGTWLPNSEYELDDRPHFEILGKKYKNGDPNSEEQIWIPVRKR